MINLKFKYKITEMKKNFYAMLLTQFNNKQLYKNEYLKQFYEVLYGWHLKAFNDCNMLYDEISSGNKK